MNSENGGLNPSERQRQAAAEIARKKVLAAYSSYQPKPSTPAETAAANAQKAEQQSSDWKKYHSAWQNYYQKYYSDYYSRAAREFVTNERQKLAAEKARLASEQAAAEKLVAEQAAQAAVLATSDTAPNATTAPVEKSVENPVQKPVENSSAPADHFQIPTNNQPTIKTTQPAPAPQSTANTQPLAAPPDPTSEPDRSFFMERLKKLSAKKASRSEKSRNRRRKFVPILAGLTVVLVLLFLQYNRLIFAPIAAYVSPGDSPSDELMSVDPTITSSVSPDPKLIIPSLNVEVPVAFGIRLSEVNQAMLTGVAQFRIQGASALPGEIGNLVISGHSAGDIYSSMQYKFIFSGLERLKANDLIYINYNSTRYTYQVTKTAVVEPTDIVALTEPTDKPMLILVTCTPLGTSRYRLLVYAEQISPSYKDAEKSDDSAVEEASPSESLPENEPTFFENIWNWLTGH